MEEGLYLLIAQDIRRLILSDGHGLYTAAVYLRKVGGVVYRKGDDDGDKLVSRNRQVEQIVRAVCNGDELEHERRTTQNGDDKAGHIRHYLAFAHPQKGDDHAERQGKQQRQKKYGAGFAEAAAHCGDHCH